MNSRRRVVAVIVTVAGLLTLFAVPVAIPAVRELITSEQLTATIDRAGLWGPVVIIGAMIIAIVVSPLPSVPITAVAGMAYGPWVATPIAALGATAGAIAAFAIARGLGHEVAERLTGRPVVFCPGCSPRSLTVLVFVSRLIPAISFDVVSYGAGLSTMSAWSFTAATFVGLLPWTWVYASLGAVVMTRPVLASAAGAVLGVAILLIPGLIRRYNPFGLRRVFEGGGPEKE